VQILSELRRRNVLRVAIAYLAVSWLLVQVVETLFPIFGLSDQLVRLVVIVLAIGFPLVLIFSWLYELTPEGLRLEKDIDRSQDDVHHTGKKLDRAIIVVLALALGYFSFDKFILDPARDTELVAETTQKVRSDTLVESYGDQSIAVLPFVDMSPDKDQEYMSDGIAEELLNLLAKVPELRVISRSSSFAYKGEKIDIPEVATNLNVAHILEGSVRKSGNQLRITAQLIEAQSDTHLWSETYDRELVNIFQIQDEIAAAVVEALKISLLGSVPKAQETDSDAYANALQAKFFWNRRSPGDEEKAMGYYQQALDIDSSYAPAWAGLSVGYLSQAVRGDIEYEPGMAKAREAARMALSLDPGLSDAHVRMGLIHVRDGNREKALAEYQLALDLDPNSSLAMGAMASFIWQTGLLEEAIDLYEKAASVDPLTPIWRSHLGRLLVRAGRLNEAQEAVLKARELSPEYNIGNTLVLIRFFSGRLEEALELTEMFPDSANKTFGLMVSYQAMGRQGESDAAMQRLLSGDRNPAPFLRAVAYAYRGDADKAFEWLERTHDAGNLGIGVYKFEPFLKNLHDDPRWDAFLNDVAEGR